MHKKNVRIHAALIAALMLTALVGRAQNNVQVDTQGQVQAQAYFKVMPTKQVKDSAAKYFILVMRAIKDTTVDFTASFHEYGIYRDECTRRLNHKQRVACWQELIREWKCSPYYTE